MNRQLQGIATWDLPEELMDVLSPCGSRLSPDVADPVLYDLVLEAAHILTSMDNA